VAPIVVTVRHVSGKIAAPVPVAPVPVAQLAVTVRHVNGKIAALVPVAPIVVTVRHVSGKIAALVPVALVPVAPTVVSARHASGKIAALVPVAPTATDAKNHRLVRYLAGRTGLSVVRSGNRSAVRLGVAIEPVKTARSSAPSSIRRPIVRLSRPIERCGSTRALSVTLLGTQPVEVGLNPQIVTVALSGARAHSSPMTANRRIDPRPSLLQVSHRNGRAPSTSALRLPRGHWIASVSGTRGAWSPR
jgi:hypothetical protein